jgi:hypothetical protein
MSEKNTPIAAPVKFLAAAQTRILPPDIPWDGKSRQFVVEPTNPWATPAEVAGFTQTPAYDETIAFLKRLAEAYPKFVELITLPEKTDEGRAFIMAILSNDADRSIAGLKTSRKPLVYMQAGIHPGEANGKDAGLMLARDLAVNETQATLLDSVNILFVPTVNIDGDMQRGRFGRINQNGPDETGWRVNSRNLNLNRDFTKLDSPEIRNVAWVLQNYDPHFFIDSHSTDGLNYQYDVTYCHNGEGWSTGANGWIERLMMPYVDDVLKSYGHIPNLCISMNDSEDISKGYYPYYSDLARFSVQYADARGIPGILVELHALKPYRQQVLGNYVLYKAILECVAAHGEKLKALVASDRLARPEKVTLTWKEAQGEPQYVEFKGVKFHRTHSDVTGDEIVLWTNEPCDYRVPVTPRITPDRIVDRPIQYVVPVQWHDVISRLEAHGIDMRRLDAPTAIDVTMYRLKGISVGNAFEPDRESADKIPSYEGRMLINGEAIAERRTVTYLPGSVVVDTNQRLGLLAMILLEPDSPDSFLRWGFFSATLTSAEAPEAYVLEPMAQRMLLESPALRAAFTAHLAANPAFAADRNARLNWFYEQTPFADSNGFVYPVGIVRD